MARVLPGLPEPLLQVGDLLPELLAVLGPVQLQKEVVALLQGLGSGGEGDDLVANPVSLQLVAADLIVQDRHVEGVPGELPQGHPDHPLPAGGDADHRGQTAHQRDFAAFLHVSLSSDVLNVLPGLFLQEAAEFREAAALQRRLLEGQGVVLSHDEDQVRPGLRQGQDPVILPPGLRRSGLYQEVVGIEGGVGGIGARQGPASGEIAVDGVLLPADHQQGDNHRAVCRRLPDVPPGDPEGHGEKGDDDPGPDADHAAPFGPHGLADRPGHGGQRL